MKYNFDQIIHRTNTASEKWDQSELLFGDKDVLPMWVADMDFMAPPEVVAALQKRAEHGIYAYTIKPLSYYEAIIEWIKRRHGWNIQKEWMITSPGVVTSLSILVSTLTEPGDNVLIQSPVYPPFYDVVKRNNRNLVIHELQLNDGYYTMDMDALEKQIEAGVKLLLLCSPHNPVGRVWKLDELKRLGEICVKHQVLIVSDEIHCDLVYRGNQHIPMASISETLLQQTITCMAPSKTFNLAGLQSSMVIIPNDRLRRRYHDMLTTLSLGMESYFGVTAVETAYRYGEPWLEDMIDYLQGNLNFVIDYFRERLPQIQVIKPEGTYLVWLDCRGLGLNSRDLHKFMSKEAKVGLNQGGAFGTNGEGFLRLNIACPRSLLLEGVKRLDRAINH
jgi:cysteine-S-conjugate beta-lyase